MSNREAVKEDMQGRHRAASPGPSAPSAEADGLWGRTLGREFCMEAFGGRQGKLAPLGRRTRRGEPGAEV